MNKKIKIGFVIENAIGGVAYYVLGQIKLLDSTRFDCSVYLFNLSWRNVTPAINIFTEIGINCLEFDVSHDMNKHRMLYNFAEKNLRYLDVIVATSKYELTAYCLAKLSNRLVLAVLADTEENFSDILEFENVLDKIVPNSEILTKKIDALVSKENVSKAIYMPQAIPFGKIKFEEQKKPEKFTITFVGRFNQYKGADFLLDIGKDLYKIVPSVHFNIVTNGIDEEEFKKNWAFKEFSGFYNNIPNEELEKLWAESHIVLMPSRNEGMPVALIEAMRLGVVPICSELENGFKELVIPDLNGYLIKVGNIDGFVKSIMEVKNDTGLFERMSVASVKLVSEKFDPYKCIDEFEDLYSNLKPRDKKKYPDTFSSLGKLDLPFLPGSAVRLYRKLSKLVTRT